MGLLSSLFGGKKSQTQTTNNAAYDQINQSFSPLLGYAAQGGSALSRFLGGDTSGFDAYKEATGYGAGLDRILSGVTGSQAARGLLRSGSTGDAYIRRAGEYDQQASNNYLQQLLGLSGLGFNAGQLIAGAAPQTTTAADTTKGGGLGKVLGLGLSLFSDPRLKTDVEKVGEEADGLGRYRFRYVWDDPGTVREGVMADQVAKLRPWALGPVVAGYATVNYARL